MFFWTPKRLIALVGCFMLVAVMTCQLPAWSQKGGIVATPSATPAPLSPKAPNANATWNLTDVLWGITRLQSSPQKLTPEQIKVVRPTVNKVVEGTKVVKSFESKVKGILTAEQLAYVEHLALTGALNKIPDNLPQGQPGQDPLVQYVVRTLEEKVGK